MKRKHVPCFYLANRFHVAVRLFSNRTQTTSNCGKNKKVAHEAIAECHWCSCQILTSSVIYYWTDARQHGIYLFDIIKKQTTTEKAFLFQNLSTWLKSRPLPRTPPTLTNTKKAIWRNLLSIQTKNFTWFKKITPLSNLARASLLVEWSVCDGGNLCPLWLEILESLWYSVGDTL